VLYLLSHSASPVLHIFGIGSFELSAQAGFNEPWEPAQSQFYGRPNWTR
jgi:hypothetical protein